MDGKFKMILPATKPYLYVDATCYPVDKLVKDLTADDLVLLGHDSPGLIGMLYFEKMPDADRFSIAVSIGTDDGRTQCDTLTIPEPIDKGIDRSRRPVLRKVCESATHLPRWFSVMYWYMGFYDFQLRKVLHKNAHLPQRA